jgi:carboxyl-terminal processing protease
LQGRANLYGKLEEIDKYVRDNYFGEISEQALNDYLARGYMAGIEDPYAMYLTADQYQRVMSSYDGQMANIGIEVKAEASGYMQVLAVYPDSPAESKGLKVGDLIVKVDDLSLTADNFDEAAAALQGESGTTVSLTIRRMGEESEVEITRRKIEVPSVDYRVIKHIGYIRIKEFNDNTPTQFNRALDRLLAQEVTALCFDVRDNPGGTLTAVTAILDVLLPAGDIVSATYKNGETVVLATSDTNEIDLPMAVLINQRSASSAELFAQALKDYQKARTVGVTTFGKGMMQTIHRLTDGSAIEFTVAQYNPPRSENFDGVGVKPDYEVKISAELEKVLFQLDEKSDPQMRKAMELLGLKSAEPIPTDWPDETSQPPEDVEQGLEDGEQSPEEGEDAAQSEDTSEQSSKAA